MVRVNAFQRSLLNLPECIEQYCTNDTDNLHLVTRHRIVVATCNMAGFLYSLDLKVGHFTHIFVDEVLFFSFSFIKVKTFWYRNLLFVCNRC